MMKALNEMARFGENITCGKNKIDIELHGGDDRIYPPHIHIYHSAERKTKSKLFTIEVNLAHFMFNGILIPCRILDRKKSVDDMGDKAKNWGRYHLYHEILSEFLESGDVKSKYTDCIDNIAVAIRVFNEEADLTQLRKEHKEMLKKRFGTISANDKFLAVMYCYGQKIKRQFRKYFTKEQQEKFRDIFE